VNSSTDRPFAGDSDDARAAQVERSVARANGAAVVRYLTAISGTEKPTQLLELYLADADLRQHVEFLERVFPGHVIRIDDVIAESDKVAVRARFQGTHGGDFMGVAPTHRTVDVPFIAIYRLSATRITEHWISIDQSELLRQLGLAG
jgi:predicted ester cyclase